MAGKAKDCVLGASSYGQTFGAKSIRKRPKLLHSDLETLISNAEVGHALWCCEGPKHNSGWIFSSTKLSLGSLPEAHAAFQASKTVLRLQSAAENYNEEKDLQRHGQEYVPKDEASDPIFKSALPKNRHPPWVCTAE